MSKTAEQQFQEWLSSQSGYTGKTKKAQWWNDHNQNQANQSSLQNLMSGGQGEFSIKGGSLNEQSGRLEGLQRAKVLTGQNPYEIGQDYQEAYGNIKKRTQQADTGSELLRASKAGAVADARNQMQAQGVKGGAALGAVSAIERAKSYDVNNMLQQNQRQAEMDYMNATKANANFTTSNEMNFGQMAMGKDVKGSPVQSNGFGNFGTVICTELFMQGYFTVETMAKDFEYGMKIRRERPAVYEGYRFLADPIVKGMKKSKLLTEAVAFFAVPWALNMAGHKNLMGATVSLFGEPLCWVVGKTISLVGAKYANQKA